MKMKCVLGATFAVLSLAIPASGQSADALVNKLVQKGILTSQEAEELRQEANRDFSKAYAAKSGWADWTTALKFNGDVRVRFDDIFSENSAYVTQQRYRVRLRVGAIWKFKDDMEAGFRLASGSDNQSLSANQTFGDNGSKKPIHIDQAYGKWSPQFGDASLTFTAGKMDIPFVFSDMVMDTDYTPEGFAEQLTYKINERHSAKLILGEFILDELATSQHDPFLFGAQARLDSQWSKRVTTSFGIAGLMIHNAASLTSSDVPDINNGNTRNTIIQTIDGKSVTNSVLANNFNPLIADGTVKYTFDSCPLYTGAFPVSLSGEFMWNPAASSRNVAWSAGPTFGKAAKKGTWEISYRWKSIEGDAWYEELVSDDFGAYYQNASGFGAKGYRTGTNVRGHVVRAAYAFTDSFALGLTYLNTELIDAIPATSISGVQRLMIDALWKF